MKTTISNISVREKGAEQYLTINSLPKEYAVDKKIAEIGPVREVKGFSSGYYAVIPLVSRRFEQYNWDKMLKTNEYSYGLEFYDETGQKLKIEKTKHGEPLIYQKYMSGFAPYVVLESQDEGKNILESGYVDMLGNLSTKKTAIGSDVYSYYSGEIEAKELINKYYFDEKIMPFILKEEKRRAIAKVLDSDGKEVNKNIFDEFVSSVADLEASFTKLREGNMASIQKKQEVALEIFKM